MKLVKKTKKTFDVTFWPTAVDWTWGSFKNTRSESGMGYKEFEKCFCCGHRFLEEEKPVIAAVRQLGNRFACAECLESDKEETDGKEMELEE